jgi:hypothetical protein
MNQNAARPNNTIGHHFLSDDYQVEVPHLKFPLFIQRYEKTAEKVSDGTQISYEPGEKER